MFQKFFNQHYRLSVIFDLIQFNNFILRWYCTIAEANKNQPLITTNMAKMYLLEADTKVISM